MPIALPRAVVEFILLGPEDDRRQLQDSPILGDVWMEYANAPGAPLELLITPYKDHSAATVAAVLADAELEHPDKDPKVAFLQGIVAASLTFRDVVRWLLPLTSWYCDQRNAPAIRAYRANPGQLVNDATEVLRAAPWRSRRPPGSFSRNVDSTARFAVLAGLILLAGQEQENLALQRLLVGDALPDAEQQRAVSAVASGLTAALAEAMPPEPAPGEPKSPPLVWTVSRNRRATPALTRSVPAVKADAARTLFTVNCSEIGWAVVDSGIQASHPAFLNRDGKETRVRKVFDFTTIRDIVSLDNAKSSNRRNERVQRLLSRNLKKPPSEAEAADTLLKLAQYARDGRAVNWELVERLVELNPDQNPPPSHHGTHVAGIIGASKQHCGPKLSAPDAAAAEAGPALPDPDDAPGSDSADGMCPDIRLYDFRVLAPTLDDTEFAIIAALQYIRYVNERNSFITIHGANLSLSIPHDVRNFACGRTPVCNECERLVNSGVVVVAAAGNRGYQNFETKEGLYEGYAAFSVTDPGNADGVITVGATHRFWPHTYGVSFFSSRGPTGDGRLKPDLVAPGERIRAPLPDNLWGDLDGTSMAAPHVSGAAAMLMARYTELVGQPRRIKQILCDSATDLGRERSFQGHGMLDVLRAFQSI